MKSPFVANANPKPAMRYKQLEGNEIHDDQNGHNWEG